MNTKQKIVVYIDISISQNAAIFCWPMMFNIKMVELNKKITTVCSELNQLNSIILDLAYLKKFRLKGRDKADEIRGSK